MRLSVRSGVFETNSSSTHSLTMADEDDFELFEKGVLLYTGDVWSSSVCVRTPFCTWEEAREYMEKIGKEINSCTPEEALDALLNEDFGSYETVFSEDDELESFIESFVSKSGDRIIAFGKFGFC